jgi:hypothetical protein
MLLNNDYYLDTKNMVMSKEISSLINNTDYLYEKLITHIEDGSLHGKDPIIIQNINQAIQGDGDLTYVAGSYNSDALSSDKIYYIPITYNVGEINTLISKVPHNLNSYTVVFVFVIPDEYKLDVDQNDPSKLVSGHEYILNVGNDNILFSNFYNGTIIVLGDFLQETKFFNKFTKKSKLKIEDPVKNDAVNIRKYISNIYNEIDDNELISEIIKFKNNEVIENGKIFNKIIIEGTCLNDYYSAITFNDVEANVYVKNLEFRNALKPDLPSSNDIKTLSLNMENLPSDEKLILLYPLESDTTPKIGETFLKMLNDSINVPIFMQLSSNLDPINESLKLFDDSISSESGLIYEIEGFKSLVSAGFSNLNTADNIALDNLIKMLDTIVLRRENISGSQPSVDLKDYQIGATNEFSVDKAKVELSNYVYYVKEFLTEFRSFFSEIGFREFLNDRKDIVDSDLVISDQDQDIVTLYKEKYYNSIFNNISGACDNIENNIINSLFGTYNFERRFELKRCGNVVVDNTLPSNQNNGILTNYSDGSCKALKLELGNSKMKNGYLEASDTYLSGLFNVLFNYKEWPNLKNKFNDVTNNTLHNSKFDSTICFWTKTSYVNLASAPYLSFKFSNADGIENICRFSLNKYQIISTIAKTNLSGSTPSSTNETNKIEYDDPEKSGLYTDHFDDWMFWCFRLDNQNLDIPDTLSGHIGVTCNVYVNVKQTNGKYEIKRYTLASNNTCYIPSPVTDENTQFKELKMYLGYSEHESSPDSNEINENYFTGYMRNFMIFAGHLTDSECIALFRNGLQTDYNFISEYYESTSKELFESGDFFIGLIGAYNVSNINILNCVMKFNGKYLKISSN